MVSSLNQVRQLYVANAFVSDSEPKAKGDIKLKVVGANSGAIQKQVYFLTKGYDTVLKSDYIPVQSITYAKATKAENLRTYMKAVLVTLSEDVNDGAPVVGQDYILRINLRQFYGMSDQDQYFKDAAVHATKNMTAETFYEEMAKALNLCFSREVGATPDSNPYLYFEAGAEGLCIYEKPQSWSLGTEAQERVYFDVIPTTIYADGEDVIWGTTTVVEGADEELVGDYAYVGNGHKIADLEYFLLGERGDQYRKIGWPNDIETKGLVDPDTEYDVFEIHYSFSDSGVNSYKTEKDITIVSPKDSGVIDAIIDAFNTATGLSITKLSEATGTAETSEEKAVVDDADVVTTEETGEEKAVVDNADEAEAQAADGDDAVGIADTAEEKAVVDGTEETTEASTEGTETVQA